MYEYLITKGLAIRDQRAVKRVCNVDCGVSALPGNDLIEQIQLARELGADGFVLFQYDEELAEQKLPALLLGVTEAPPLRGWKK